MDNDKVHQIVKETYGQTAREAQEPTLTQSCCCGPAAPGPSCCDTALSTPELSQLLGYSQEEMDALPELANLGLGCGNPGAIAALREGETVLDLGSGAGIDCFLSARKVGPMGQVIGIDMTDDMLALANSNAVKGDYTNVEFRKGQIEKMPVEDEEVDVIISNCVVNLSPDKEAVYREAFRVLRPGGRLAISDIVASIELPEQIRNDARLLAACVAGAETKADLEAILYKVGFQKIRIQPKDSSGKLIQEWAPGSHLENFIFSAYIEAVKPQDA